MIGKKMRIGRAMPWRAVASQLRGGRSPLPTGSSEYSCISRPSFAFRELGINASDDNSTLSDS